VSEYAIFLHGLVQQWQPQDEQNITQR